MAATCAASLVGCRTCEVVLAYMGLLVLASEMDIHYNLESSGSAASGLLQCSIRKFVVGP